MKKAGIYIRVSTQEQVEGYSIQAQKERLINFCKAKDWNIVDIYVDGGFTGSNLDRPAMQKLIGDINRLDLVLVYKLDRLSRSQKDTLHLIEDVFLKNNVDFVSMNESFDTSTPFGRAMIGILSVFAQLERETIKERSQMGKIERAKEGLFHGGGFTPIGYDYIDGKLIVNEYEAMQVREVIDLYLAGNGADKIAKTMHSKGYKHKNGAWKFTSSVRNILENPLYIGKITYCGLHYEGIHEPLISPETYQKVQTIRNAKNNAYKTDYESTSLLSGFIYCGNCGSRYFVRRVNNKYGYYSCYSRIKSHRHMIKDPTCRNKNWRMLELDRLIEDEVIKLSFNDNYYNELISNKQETPSIIDNRIITAKINDIDKQINKLMDLYQINNMPVEEIGKRIELLYNEKKELQKQISKTVVSNVDSFNIEGTRLFLDSVKYMWEDAGVEEKRNVLRSLINRILIYGAEIKIDWSFT